MRWTLTHISSRGDKQVKLNTNLDNDAVSVEFNNLLVEGGGYYPAILVLTVIELYRKGKSTCYVSQLVLVRQLAFFLLYIIFP